MKHIAFLEILFNVYGKSLRKYIFLYVRNVYTTIAIKSILLLLRIPHQVFNSAIKRFFSNLINFYTLIIKFCGCKLLFIKSNYINIDWNDSVKN